MSFAKVRLTDGLTAYEYKATPKGELVVFLHGGTMPSWCYDAQIPVLNALGYKTLRYDMYGRGASDAPETRYDRALYLRQLRELILFLQIKGKVHLVGTSFGGATAIHYALHETEHVGRLILISPAIDWIANQPLARLLRIPGLGRALFETVAKRRALKRGVGFLSSLKGDLARRYTDLFLNQTKQPGFWRTLFSMLTSDAFNDYRPELRLLAEKGFTDLELLWGDGDEEIRQPEIRDLLYYFPNTKMTEAHGSGHGLMAEDPDQINTFIVNSLIKSLPTKVG